MNSVEAFSADIDNSAISSSDQIRLEKEALYPFQNPPVH